ncbi:hypothetical protein BGZ97_006119 [Linnemannia gamsii]|uniref:Rho-GAP domain-containing protein n=1 Tax=Linnemannia gamsii TaxID=64522 RepID=A0A9P6REK5_9FUNG|nr:hypothetical protein BGZ97_006119 [Linnemannia gamsii]
MSLRLVSSARNLRDQFKGGNNSQQQTGNSTTSSGSSIFTNASNVSNIKTLDPSGVPSGGSILSRQGTLLRAQSNGNLRRAKSIQKKSNMGRGDSSMPDLSMEVTRVIVKRCIKEIRLTTKGILRQVQMAQSKEVVMDTIRLILDDDSNTQLSLLRQVDIHLVAHAMKWAIRYSEEILVTYADYQTLYLDQDRSFSRFVHDLPPTNRAILLDLFSLCADVTLLAHLNGMTLVVVAKAISLSIMAEPEREFTTFDASLQQRNLWGAACEDLLRAFLRIKTTHDLAKIEQEDGVDENRYVDNITREVRSARQRSNETGAMPNMPMYSRPDMSVPSSAGSMPASSGWPSTMTPTGMGRPTNGYFDHAPTPRSASPLSQQSSSIHESSLSRSHSLAKSNSSRSRPLSPAVPYENEKHEYEEMMQDQSHLERLRHQSRQSLMPGFDKDRRRSSVADMESLYMLPVDASEDGYESEPEPSHKSLVLEFSDGLGWDFSKLDDLQKDQPVKESLQSGVYRSNSSSSNGSALVTGAQNVTLSSFDNDELSPLQRASTTGNKARVGHAINPGHTSPSMNPQRAKRNSLLRRSVSLDPHTMHGRVHKKPNELRQDILTRELAIQAERSQVAEDIRTRLLQSKQSAGQSGSASPSRSTFSLESSPLDLDRPAIPTRSASQGLGRSMSKSSTADAKKLEINVGSLPPRHSPAGLGMTDELTPVSNPSSNSSIASPKPLQPSSNNMERNPEIVSRPKETEVCVHFSPITPVSPKAEMRSKFQESFSDKPMSPPAGYAQGQHSDAGSRHNRSPSTKSSQGSRMSPSSSTMSSPMQTKSLSRSNSKTLVPPHPPQLQHSATFSGSSSAPISAAPEGKFKASGFIRALSYKLRSKQSDEQLKPVKINNQVVGAPPVAPAVSIQPPRLELSFLGDLGGPATGITPAAGPATAAHPLNESNLPPASAPANLLHLNGASNGGADTVEGWRRAAQDSLPVPPLPIDRSAPKAVREQRRKSRISMSSPRSSPSSQSYLQANFSKADGKRPGASASAHTVGRKPHRLSNGRTLSDSSYTTDDSASLDDSAALPSIQNETPALSAAAATTSPKKAGEREYRFSTATLLKDGKLYYQLQWDAFSEGGFTSDFFEQPEQYLTGLSQKRMSKMPAPGGPGVNASLGGSTSSTTSRGQTPVAGQVVGQGQGQDPGPSPAQKAAALKAARQSFMALAKDPKALAALKAGSTGGIGQATIIGTGSFPIGSAQPILQTVPINLNPTSEPAAKSSMAMNSSSPRKPSPLSQQPVPPSQQMPLQSALVDSDKLQRSTSGKSLPTSSAPGVPPALQEVPKATAKHGKPSMPAGGAASLSLLPAPSPATLKGPVAATPVPVPVQAQVVVPPVPAKKSRLFGTRFKASSSNKKSNRLSTSVNSPVPATGGQLGGKKKKSQQGGLTRMQESAEEVFPFSSVEHMTGVESGWVMLEPVKDGAVGWIKIDRLEEEMARLTEKQQQRQMMMQREPFF